MKNSSLEFARREKLFFPGCRVLCAVSGGADSVALLLWLLECRSLLGIQLLGCAHYHHGLRGAESDEDAVFVKSLAQKWEIPFFMGKGDVAAQAAKTGKGIEETGREMRYAFLQGISGFDRIATAHTGDDNLETMLLHLVRGGGLRGLCGIPPRRGKIVRPLLTASREDVERFLFQRNQPYRQDSSNFSDLYRRNRIRQQVVPLLKQENPALVQVAAANAAFLRADAAALEHQAETCMQQVEPVEGGIQAEVDWLKRLPRAIMLRVLRNMAAEVTARRLSAKNLLLMEGLLLGESPSAQCSLPGAIARRCYQKLLVERPRTETSFPEQDIVPDGIPRKWGTIWQITGKIVENDREILQTVHTFLLNYDIMKGDLVVRSRRRGDRIQLKGWKEPRLLSDQMVNLKIPLSERNQIPVFCVGDEVVAVHGLGVADRYVAKPDGRKFLINVEQSQKEETI